MTETGSFLAYLSVQKQARPGNVFVLYDQKM